MTLRLRRPHPPRELPFPQSTGNVELRVKVSLIAINRTVKLQYEEGLY